MPKLSKRHKENVEKTKNKIYTNLDEAIQVLKETATAKFVESVELHANLNIDPKYADQQLRTTVTLPHGIGKQVKIAVLTTDENYAEATKAGADIVGNDETSSTHPCRHERSNKIRTSSLGWIFLQRG